MDFPSTLAYDSLVKETEEKKNNFSFKFHFQSFLRSSTSFDKRDISISEGFRNPFNFGRVSKDTF